MSLSFTSLRNAEEVGQTYLSRELRFSISVTGCKELPRDRKELHTTRLNNTLLALNSPSTFNVIVPGAQLFPGVG